MCTNNRIIRNRYTMQRLYVPCGKCPACLQERANKRTSRLRAGDVQFGTPLYHKFFITLTYANKFIPYIRLSDLYDLDISEDICLPVYRDNDTRLVVGDFYKDESGKRVRALACSLEGHKVLARLSAIDLGRRGQDFDFFTWREQGLDGYPSNFIREWIDRDHWRFTDKDRIPVLWYADIQNYIKRVNKQLLKYEINFKYFVTTEYGETTGRPHAHIVAYVPVRHYLLCEHIFREAWSYDARPERRVENVRFDVSQYAASYVNSHSYTPKLFSLTRVFSPKAIFSKNFAYGREYYTLASLIDMHKRGDFGIPCQVMRNGIPTRDTISLPSYVVSRYLPRFKGYCWLAPDEIRDVVERPQNYRQISLRLAKRGLIEYDEEVVRKTIVMLRNKYWQFCQDLGIPTDSLVEHRVVLERVRRGKKVYERLVMKKFRKENPYCPHWSDLYYYVWSSYSAYMLKRSFDTYDTSHQAITAHYNVEFCGSTFFQVFDLDGCPPDWLDQNKHPETIRRTAELSDLYNDLDKKKKANNSIASYQINV